MEVTYQDMVYRPTYRPSTNPAVHPGHQPGSQPSNAKTPGPISTISYHKIYLRIVVVNAKTVTTIVR